MDPYTSNHRTKMLARSDSDPGILKPCQSSWNHAAAIVKQEGVQGITYSNPEILKPWVHAPAITDQQILARTDSDSEILKS